MRSPHRLTQPRSPTTTGKIERFHLTLRRELLDDARPFVSILAAQAAIDDWVRDDNATRPHQALELRTPVTPAERFRPADAGERELLPLWTRPASRSRPSRNRLRRLSARLPPAPTSDRSTAGRSSLAALLVTTFRPDPVYPTLVAGSPGWTAAPRTGVYKLDAEGRISWARWANDWHNLVDDSEAFYLSVASVGDYRYTGADLGVLVTRERMQTDDGELTDRCRLWLEGIKTQFAGSPPAPADVRDGAALK